MFFFGHTGIAFKAARKLNRNASLALVVAIAMLPDVVDKTIHYIVSPTFTNGNTRTICHSLLATFLFSLALFLVSRNSKNKAIKWLWVIPWVHIVLDEMWEPEMRVSLLWPFLGLEFPVFDHKGVVDHLHRIFRKPQVIIGELVGLWIFYGHYRSIAKKTK